MYKKKPKNIGGVPHQAKPFLVNELISKKDIGAYPFVLFLNQTTDLVPFKEIIQNLIPDVQVCIFPEWDTLPYDRVSPSDLATTQRLETLGSLIHNANKTIILTTMAAVIMPTIPAALLKLNSISHTETDPKTRQEILDFAQNTGYLRVDVVKNKGEYAVRGSLIDIFFIGEQAPLRLDFFDEELETIKTFSEETQVTEDKVTSFMGLPTSEIVLNKTSIDHFRTAYRKRFGTKAYNHPLYNEISNGHRFSGMEHWLPLFYDYPETMLSYLADPIIMYEGRDADGLAVFCENIRDAYLFREKTYESGTSDFAPLPPSDLYQSQQLQIVLESGQIIKTSPFRGKEMENYNARALPPLLAEGDGKRSRFNAFKNISNLEKKQVDVL